MPVKNRRVKFPTATHKLLKPTGDFRLSVIFRYEIYNVTGRVNRESSNHEIWQFVKLSKRIGNTGNRQKFGRQMPSGRRKRQRFVSGEVKP